jgi:predicted site-specific integrase-resolvase
VAEIFGVSKKTVYQWRYAGKLDGVHIAGGPLRFKRVALIKIISESE